MVNCLAIAICRFSEMQVLIMRQHRPTRRRARSTEAAPKASVSPERSGMLFASAVMMLAGWGGLAQLIMTTRPRIGGEIWLFFILLQIAATGTAIPIVRYLSMRLMPTSAASSLAGVVVRRSVWAGIMAAACAWLLIPRALSLSFVLILLLLFIVIEIFLRNREPTHER